VRVPVRPRPGEDDLAQAPGVHPPQLAGDAPDDAARVEQARDVLGPRLGPARERRLGGGRVDQPALGEPGDRPPLAAGVVEGEPGPAQLGPVEQRVLEAAEGAAADDRAPEQVARAGVADERDEVLHVAVADGGGEGVDRHEPARRRLLAAAEARLDLARARVEPPAMVGRVVLEREREVGEVERAGVERHHVQRRARSSSSSSTSLARTSSTARRQAGTSPRSAARASRR